MGKQIKLPNIDFVKVGNTLVESGKTAGAFVKNHATEFLAGALAGVTIDNIRIRMGRKKDKKAFEENAHKQQQVIRKHEAEINVFVIEGVGDTSVPIRLAVSNSGTVVRSNDTVSIYIFILHHTRFHRLTGMFAYICHSGFQLH